MTSMRFGESSGRRKDREMNELIHAFEGLGRIIILWSWQLALFIAFLWLIVRVDRRHRPEFRHRLWTLALVVSLALPWALQGIASLSWTMRAKEVWTDPRATVVLRIEPPANAVTLQPMKEESVEGAAARPAAGTSGMTFVSSARVLRLIGLLWLLGVLIGAARRIREHRRIRAIVTRSEVVPFENLVPERMEMPLRILLSSEVSNPMLYGLVRPVILLPKNIEEWSTPEERTTIIRHEYVHFRRKHHWVSSLQALAKAALFFHPLFRWMCRQLDVERELVCDAEVLRSGADPDRYAETLLLVAEHAIAGHAGVHFATKAQLSRRLDFLFRAHHTAAVALIAVPLILLTPVLALGFWQTRVEPIEAIESTWLIRLLPGVPAEAPETVAVVPIAPPPSSPKAMRQEPATPLPPQPDMRFRVAINVLKGPDADRNEVRVAVGFPYSSLFFSQSGRTVAAAVEANGTFAMRISRLAGGVAERVEQPFQVSVLSSQYQRSGLAVLEQVFLLSPGAYSFFISASDSTTGELGLMERRLEVPRISQTDLATSSLIVADMIDSGPGIRFRIGDLRARPNTTGRFRRNQELRIAQQ